MEGTRARHPRSPPHSPPPDLCQVLPLPRRLSGLRRLLCSSRVPEMPEGVGATDRQRHDLLQAARGNQPHLQHARQREAGQRGFLLVRGSHSQRASRTSHTRCCRCRCCYRCPPPPLALQPCVRAPRLVLHPTPPWVRGQLQRCHWLLQVPCQQVAGEAMRQRGPVRKLQGHGVPSRRLLQRRLLQVSQGQVQVACRRREGRL